ncbi:LOW QUALITY PROTEIN: growth/differentiation factor 2 [Pleuronectes platessa]|uniref:LOW QUALITY PROTEIN: growth/differentiation factor 2 n=1 Tax=Pleuronectes platessa TaxID=8262 RepID=UPI00232A1FC0|nr:LOW QUALITY PROTEIN: growth/differentiation factor 2 [Pleuronectes platessa]
MGADIRTVVLAWGISIFRPCHRKVCFQAGKKLCLSLVVSSGSCTCKPLNNDIQSDNPEELYSQLSEEDLLEEEAADLKMENLLGTMKEGFLRKLNLSDVPQEHSKIDPPQFMMELYNKYASDSSAIPQSDVIRSCTVQDITLSSTNGTKSKYRLQFNDTIPNHEKITNAELHLFFYPEARSRLTSHSFQATVKVYEVDEKDFTSTTHLLVGKEVTGPQSTWTTFDVTAAIQSWIKSGNGATVIDVVVDRKNCGASGIGEAGAGCLNMSMSVGDNTSAALIVFSDDLGSRRRENKKEIKEMILHEEETILHSGADWNRGEQLPNTILEVQRPRRNKRKAEREYCRRTSLKVNFKDIGWDSWIVAPPGYDAFECRGLCYHPLTDESTPSKHALIQTLINIRDPKRANMACCVPIKLDPITVMYQENGRLTIRYLYEEMKVAECGCR